MTDFTDPYIETFSGERFYIDDLAETSSINIIDIAHALSNICRFTGHCSRFYSVAEHSYLASYMAPKGYELHALMHDASEAYICDIAKPFKSRLDNYEEIESSIMKRIGVKFGLPLNFENHPIVKDIDVALLMYEAKRLVPSGGKGWVEDSLIKVDAEELLKEVSVGVSIGKGPNMAELLFLNRFKSLVENQED